LNTGDALPSGVLYSPSSTLNQLSYGPVGASVPRNVGGQTPCPSVSFVPNVI
jgi:hypothetical protein